MPSFRDRPLSWLFFLAAASLGAVDFTRGRGETTLAMLLTGAVYIAGAWAAVANVHRLIRGAAVVIAPFAATVPFYALSASSDEVGAILAVTFIVSLASFCAAAVTSLIIGPFNSPAPVRRDRRWRISLSEILGWTIVVAIGSVAVGRSTLPGGGWRWIAIEATNAVPFAAMVALFLAPRPRRDRAAAVATALLFCAWALLTAIFRGGPYLPILDSQVATVLVFCFVGVWIVCVRIDEGALTAARLKEPEPAIKLHDEASREES